MTGQASKAWEKHDLKYYLFTHIHFDILYNGDRVIEVNVSTDPTRTVDITEGDNTIVDFTYSVKWRETTIPFEKRMDKYSRYSFLPQHLEVRDTALFQSNDVNLLEGQTTSMQSMLILVSHISTTHVNQDRSRVLMQGFSLVFADPLVLHHQQLCDGAAADGLPGHHPHARAEERLHQVHA